MKDQKLSNILGLYLAGALVLAAAAFLLVIKPSYAKATKTTSDIKIEQVKVANLKQLDLDTQKLRQNYDAVKEQRDLILSQLPAKQEEERLLALLSQVAGENGVVMQSFAPGGVPSSETASLSVYGAGISVSGTYGQVQAFIRSLEKSARFIDITQVSLSSTAGSKAVSASIGLQAYYQQPGALTGGANGK